jgi:hypothetical protein
MLTIQTRPSHIEPDSKRGTLLFLKPSLLFLVNQKTRLYRLQLCSVWQLIAFWGAKPPVIGTGAGPVRIIFDSFGTDTSRPATLMAARHWPRGHCFILKDGGTPGLSSAMSARPVTQRFSPMLTERHEPDLFVEVLSTLMCRL